MRKTGLHNGMAGARAGALLLGLAAGLAAAFGPAQAEKVGVAAAVNPDAFSSLSQTPNKQLNIGKSIFYNERINTTASGLVQVLLVDGSTFTVGPNSDLVIDKFVYNPQKKSGELVATFSKGAMRFVGGKLSKNEGGVNVKTPAGALAIRGGIFQARLVGSRGVFSFVYGNYLKLGNYTAFEPGYTIDTTADTPTIRPTTSQDINAIMAALTNSNTTPIDSSGDDPSNPDIQQASTTDFSQLISDATATQIQDQILEQLNQNEPTVKTVDLPDEVELRVLTSPDFYVANRNSFWHQTYIGPTPWNDDYTPGAHGILGGDDYKYWCGFDPGLCSEGQWFFEVTSDDHEVHADIAGGRATGTVPRLIERDGFWFDLTEEAQFDLPIFNTAGPHSFTNGMLIEGDLVTPLTGVAFTGRDGGFFAYQMFENGNLDNPILAFGGSTFQKPLDEPDKVRLFRLYSDPRQGIRIPFAAAAFAPSNTTNASVSPLYLLEANVSVLDEPSIQAFNDFVPPPPSPPSVWVQTSYLVSGQGPNQQSIVVLALGTYDQETGLTGVRRGSAAFSDPDLELDYTEMVVFSGGIASLASPDGAHLMGNTVPHMMIGADSTGKAHDIFQDSPLVQQGDPSQFLGATYHVGEQISSTNVNDLAKTPGDYYGYAAGMYQQVEGWGSEPELSGGMLMNESPYDVHLRFKDDNRLSALFRLDNVEDGGGANFAFGDWGNYSAGHSAFVSDRIYAATEANVQTTVSLENYLGLQTADATTYLVSSGLLNPNIALCNQCDFMRWGAWGGELKFKDGWAPVTADVNLGWYVAGKLTSSDQDTDFLAALGGSATFNGNAVGNVARLEGEAWKTYVATGSAEMFWSFSDRSGSLNINNFDGQNFSYPNLAQVPGAGSTYINQFRGDISSDVFTGRAVGSFVNNGTTPAAGAIGNWNASNPTYKVDGIFGVRR